MPLIIRANLENELKFKAMINEWPELRRLVKSLINADLFPGIRNMTLTVDDSHKGDPFTLSRPNDETP